MIKFKMKSEGPPINDERLIEEVKVHEFLYDTRNVDYRNLPLRATVWAQIAKSLDIEDQNLVQKRWKVLREKFAVAYRKFVADEIASNWIFYDALTFLQPFVNLKPDNKKSSSSADEAKDTAHRKPPVPKSPLDEQYLIALIKQRPVLYDKKHEDFRVSDARRRAWDEIALTANWDVATLQKRWRVMRDRFVRELRRSKNADSDTHISCSSFFREMLFLTHHVRSKRYEVEAHLDASDDDGDFEWRVEEEIAAEEPASESENQAPLVDDGNESDELIEEIVEEGEDDGQYEIIVQEQLPPEVEPDGEEEEEEEEAVLGSDRKRRMSENREEPQPPAKVSRAAEADEDLAFGNTIGCMLKKIPAYLKTAVKLKLLQSLADFEAQHKLA